MENNELLYEISSMLDRKFADFTERQLPDILDKRFSDFAENQLPDILDRKLSGILDERLEPINKRLEKIESEVGSLKSGQLELRKEVRQLTDRVEDTYSLALENWGQIEESKVRLTALEA